MRERFFGNYEGKSNTNYDLVWIEDAKDASHTIEGVESVVSVAARAQSLIDELEQKFENHVIVLVSHGDTLQIMQAQCFTQGKYTVSQHRSLPHLNTCELRNL